MDDALLARLQKNTLEDDDDKYKRSGENDSDISEDEETKSSFQDEDFTTTMAMRQGGRHTGPKGVIDDQKYQQQLDTAKKQQQIADYNAKLLAKAPMTTTYIQDQQQMELILEPPKRQEEKEEVFEEDEQVIQQYRKKRLEELKKLKNHDIRQSHRIFGYVQDVDVDDYAEAIDKEWRTVPVIVHLYDDSLENCRHLDFILQGLARKYCLAKMIRVSALDLEFDLVGSPAILGYKSGMLVANLVRLDDEVGSRYTAETVEDVLVRHEALSEDDLYIIPEKDDNDDDDFD
ncbi:thioredoxin-like protein [Halteromyces radiatus]|uniref:thioredoxin-like protein n=1 Tax=Halteromyces radiatus TaxID=101107 RepID=UPI00221E9F14|nr:thioredoxin-like protein [Halteromyces radiatus]KAI8097740.1 thioredoxin-like protein [Halteromyces radiatus]